VSRAGTTTRDRTGRRRSSERRRPAERRSPSSVTALPRRPSRQRGPSRRRRPLQLAAAALVVLAAAWAVWAGPLLAVGTVRVDGADMLPADQVREVAGVAEGTPLLRVDVDAAAARVARLPQVADAEVTRGWPRTVVITIVERVPVAVVGQAGRRSLVDAHGVLFDSISGDPPRGVVPLDVAEPGADDPATMAALDALVALPATVRDRVAAAAATSAEDVSLTLDDGTVVRWGGAAESAEKADVLTALLAQMVDGRLEPAAVVDVSAPEAVVLR
jgi:cell division protein FtsQ